MEAVTFLKSSHGLISYASSGIGWSQPGSDSHQECAQATWCLRIVNVGLVFVNMNHPLTVCVHFFSSFIYQTVSL